jgi:hypothetical protein
VSLVTPVGVDDRRSHLTRRTVVSALVIASSISVAMLIALVLFPDHGGLVLRAYFGSLALFLSLRLINTVLPAAFGDAPTFEVRRSRKMPRPPPNWPADLFEMQDRVSLASVSEFDYNTRLRPLLRDLATQRLASRWNVDLSRQPDQARDHLGDELWTALDDDDGHVGRRDAPGPSRARLRVLIEALERI